MWVTLKNDRRVLDLDGYIDLYPVDFATDPKFQIELVRADGGKNWIMYSTCEDRDSDFKRIVDKIMASNGTQNGTS